MVDYGSLVYKAVQNVSVIGVMAFLVTRLPSVYNALTPSRNNLYNKLILGAVFGLLSAAGNWMSIALDYGFLANTRQIGVEAGGLLGGPLVGLLAGILGAVPRLFLGGFTMWAAVISNIMVGIISGLVYKRVGPKKINLGLAALIGFLGECTLKIVVLTISKPFEAAWQLEKVIAIPTITLNTLGVIFFVYIVRDVFNKQEKAQASSVQQAISMLNQTSGFMQDGLNENTAEKVAAIIHKDLKTAAVAVTDREKVLAYIGVGSDHHTIGSPMITAATKQMIETRHYVMVNDREGVGCPNPYCKLSAVINAPLIVSNELVGSIKLYKAGNEVISSHEAELIQGIANFLSLQLAQKKLDEQQLLLLQVENQMLRAQVNPHFFFNTLSTIQALIPSKPEKSIALIKDLADFFRKTLYRNQEVVAVEEELEAVRNYVHIEKVRFEDRINVVEALPAELLKYKIPIFSLQILVENAIRHGVSLKKGCGTVQIYGGSDADSWYINVEDDGVGISEERLEELKKGELAKSPNGIGIGLLNIQRRMQKIYGDAYDLQIKSQPNKGTSITIRFPLG